MGYFYKLFITLNLFISDTIIPTDITHHVDESESPTQTEKLETTLQDESEGTKESELTDGFEITTESSDEVTKKETEDDDDDYEIVDDTNCDDGEWIEVEKKGVSIFQILIFLL